ncbi:thioredoxin domain-containing protein [uncultured Rhodospira sp.]|uniref:thioredoxin domain-containing protein n=1 Tax=uncultured Rhodospira sp. TaxID=1936189 RepID=UPI00260724FE|nr:thioredoxin domain-containing protein [uncultured Rhodospira sp.]
MSRNRLGDETSPYLLQHKDNPVHWWAWGPEALAAATTGNKPILLSVGYAACHWCHVMAHESFENPDIAALMNDLFVNIKVDREERPDVDAVYMTALSMMGEQTGWPLTMFLMPDGTPFTGGTYFPPEPRYGRMGFPQVLRRVSEVYHAGDGQVARAAASLRQALDQSASAGGDDAPLPNTADLDAWARALAGHVDPVHGGLQGAPKFPMAYAFAALWRAHRRTGEAPLGEAVRRTLHRMAQGGIWDHLGGGLARYSTDETWLVPHFEKMLYDNAQWIDLLTRVWTADRAPLWRTRVEETVAWLEREMRAENGAFAAALDADSEGEEGKFYVWTADEIDAVLGDDPETLALVKAAYDVAPAGNWEGTVILNRSGAQPEPSEETEDRLASARARLLAARESRVRPARDDKVLADWTGLTIAALVRAGLAFDRPDWLARAAEAFQAVVDTMTWTDDAGRARLGHAWRLGKLKRTAVVDDYGHMALAALALFEATGEGAYLDRARTWVETAAALYQDAEAGGFFLTAADADDLIVRHKTAVDNPTPSGNGAMAVALARLWLLTGEGRYRDLAEGTVRAFGGILARLYPHSATLLEALELLEGGTQVVLVGPADADATRALARAVGESAAPGLVVTRLRPEQTLPPDHPAHGKAMVDDRPTAYVCRGPVCSAPVTAADDLAARLAA